MRLAAVAAIALLTAAGIATQVGFGQRAPDRVSVSVTTADVRESTSKRTDVLLLWNLNVRNAPIGHAVKACIKAGSGGLLGGGLLSCDLTISLPLGKVTATGIVHNLRRYTLVVTGGTGAYANAHGPLFVRSTTGNGVRRLTFFAS